VNKAYQYYKPFYLTDFTPVYPLKEMGDTSVMFFEVKYRIRPEAYVSKTKGETEFPSLTDIVAYNGKSVIPNWIDKSKYRLLKEKVEFEKFYNTVTETYGFTPTTSKFESKTITSWTRPAFDKRYVGGYENAVVNSFSYNEDTQTHTLNFTSNIPVASVGDVIKLISSDYEYIDETSDYQEDELRYQEAEVIVKEVTNTSITTDIFSFKIKRSSDGYILDTCLSTDTEKSAFYIDNIKFTASIPINSKTIYVGAGIATSDNLYKFNIENDIYIATIGDIVKFINPGVIVNGSITTWASGDVPIVDKDGKYLYVQDFEVNTYGLYGESTGTYKYSEITRDISRDAYMRRIAISARSAFSGDFVGSMVVEYKHISDVKNLQPAWRPIIGRNFTDTISAGSKPNFDEYDEMVLNKTRVLAQPQTAERFIGDIYKITSIYIEAQ
jgi:hypothetical protein